MGNRLSKIYTRTGDAGSTGLGDGSRVAKDDLRVAAYGAVDELNSAIGLLVSAKLNEATTAGLNNIQHDLFDIGGELCIPGHTAVENSKVEALETWLDAMNAELEPLQEFILPGGCEAAARAHLARTIARRAERDMVSLMNSNGNDDDAKVNPASLRYVNRLSDLLFVLARWLNKQAGVHDVLWRHER